MPRHDDAAGSVQQAGAGASLRFSWPPGADQTGSTNGYTKYNAVTGVGTMSATGIVGGTSTSNSIRLGRNSLRLNSTVGTGFSMRPGFAVGPMTERAGGALNDDFLAFSLRVTMSIPVLTGPLGNRDCGLFLVCSNRTPTPASANQAGVLVGPTDVANASVRIRAWNTDGIVGAPTVNTALLTTIDYTTWHTWELRGVWGSASADPYLQVSVDGIPQSARISWTAAAALLPSLSVVAGSPYVTVGVVNNSNAIASAVHIAAITFTMANSAAGLA